MTRRTLRRLGALALAASLTIGATASTTIGATPMVGTFGSNLSPNFVSYGGLAAFTVTATDNDTSTLSQFFLTETVGYDVYAATTSQGGCTQDGQLLCTFGQVKPGQTVSVTVALTAPTSGASMKPDFEFSTTGFVVLKGKNKSHGDAFPVTQDLTVLLTDPNGDQAGTYVWDANQSTVQDGGITSGNKQSTKVTVDFSVVGQIPTTVQDGFTDRACGTLNVLVADCPTSFFGETSEVNVNNEFHYGTLFQVVIVMYRPGVNANQVNGVYHKWSSGDELIQTPCPTSGTPTVECFTATPTSNGSKNIQIVVWLFGNGRINGW